MTGAAVVAALALSALVPSAAGAETGGRPPVALVAAPAHVLLPGAESRLVRLSNPGRSTVVVEARASGYALDARGRPRIAPGAPRAWFAVTPARVAVAGGGGASLHVSARVPHRARPGDHTALLLLTTRPLRRAGVPTRIRLGVVVVVRAPGRIVHRLAVVAAGLRRVRAARVVEVRLANLGNVDEWVGSRRLSVSFRRNGRALAAVHPGARSFLARSSGVVTARLPGSLRGTVVAVVSLARPRPGVALVRRRYRLRL